MPFASQPYHKNISSSSSSSSSSSLSSSSSSSSILWTDRELKERIWMSLCYIIKLYSLIQYSSLVIKQNGESQNRGNKKAKHTKFSEKRIFLNPWYAHVHVCFSENLACFAFTLPPFWDSLFCLITNELWGWKLKEQEQNQTRWMQNCCGNKNKFSNFPWILGSVNFVRKDWYQRPRDGATCYLWNQCVLTL